MHETDLHLEPNEASDLCPVFDPETLRARGWDEALLTVLDEAPVEEALALIVHEAGAVHGEGWTAMRVPADAGEAEGKTDDSEACARRDGFVYVMGSQFGKKAGPLAAKRSWIARAPEQALLDALDGGTPVQLEVARTRFAIHRAVNDALAAAKIEVLEIGARSRAAYIDATIAVGEEKSKRWAGRVRAADHPINVEGIEFRADGALLVGLRYPVTARGQAILVELDDVDALFTDPETPPACARVWVLDGVGTAAEPVGIRALHTHGDDRFDAIVGDLDAQNKGATVLEDHPHGGHATSRHVRFTLPAGNAGGGTVTAETVHDFGAVRRVEGIVVDPAGTAHYVLDEEGHVALRTLELADLAAASD
ncbi:MAG TPA: hypothetical protein VN238_08505 [Solirubrobacteraceae bacterium]|nr:hypothetical protein [Solirubrobacteraceae bacterium]